jgi:hypothetical protein
VASECMLHLPHACHRLSTSCLCNSEYVVLALCLPPTVCLSRHGFKRCHPTNVRQFPPNVSNQVLHQRLPCRRECRSCTGAIKLHDAHNVSA